MEPTPAASAVFPAIFGEVDLGDILGNIFGGGEVLAAAGKPIAAAKRLAAKILPSKQKSRLHEKPTKASAKKPLRVTRAERYETCGGSGAKPGTSATTCKTCGGAGQVRSQRGFFMMAQTCPTCHGEGKVIASPCSTCRGAGAVEKTSTLDG